MKRNKLFSLIVLSILPFSLAACGSQQTSNAKKDTSERTSQKKSSTKHKTETTSSTTSNASSSHYSVSSTRVNNKSQIATSNVSSSSSSSTTDTVTMTAQDAKNLVKSHIVNQFNIRGEAGQSTDDLPSVDSIDSYSVTRNGVNDWTVSGNGHSFHVTDKAIVGN
ncbi:hypothetical protein [uncultured Lentilactobacillus sp.]|uniref:hypothetical protein n=1 Tax=uncultured Lentilactobacillus sp. TaxID=2805375 RepID=UPI002592C0AF|nr:hypothetical protein [uncultured Lentilactobacillus sp.]